MSAERMWEYFEQYVSDKILPAMEAKDEEKSIVLLHTLNKEIKEKFKASLSDLLKDDLLNSQNLLFVSAQLGYEKFIQEIVKYSTQELHQTQREINGRIVWPYQVALDFNHPEAAQKLYDKLCVDNGIFNQIQIIKANNPANTEVGISHNKVMDGEVCLIEEALKENTTLKSIELDYNLLTQIGVCEIIKNNQSITSINFIGNQISDFTEVGKILEEDTIIKEIFVEDNPAGRDSDGTAYLPLFKIFYDKNTTLQYIDIMSDPGEDEGFSPLYKHLLEQTCPIMERNAKYNKIRKVISFARKILNESSASFEASLDQVHKKINEVMPICEKLAAEKNYGAEKLLSELLGVVALIYERTNQLRELLELYLKYFIKRSEFCNDDVSFALANSLQRDHDLMEDKERWALIVLLLKDTQHEDAKKLLTLCYDALKENKKVLDYNKLETLTFPGNPEEIRKVLDIHSTFENKLTYLLSDLMENLCRRENKCEDDKESVFTYSSESAQTLFHSSKQSRKRKEGTEEMSENKRRKVETSSNGMTDMNAGDNKEKNIPMT